MKNIRVSFQYKIYLFTLTFLYSWLQNKWENYSLKHKLSTITTRIQWNVFDVVLFILEFICLSKSDNWKKQYRFRLQIDHASLKQVLIKNVFYLTSTILTSNKTNHVFSLSFLCDVGDNTLAQWRLSLLTAWWIRSREVMRLSPGQSHFLRFHAAAILFYIFQRINCYARDVYFSESHLSLVRNLKVLF